MCGNISLLTGLCVVWFFITKTRGDVALTNLTRGYHDTFTNLFCNCSDYGAKQEFSGNANVCKCQSGPKQSGSLFLRSKRSCTYGSELMGKGKFEAKFKFKVSLFLGPINWKLIRSRGYRTTFGA